GGPAAIVAVVTRPAIVASAAATTRRSSGRLTPSSMPRTKPLTPHEVDPMLPPSPPPGTCCACRGGALARSLSRTEPHSCGERRRPLSADPMQADQVARDDAHLR